MLVRVSREAPKVAEARTFCKGHILDVHKAGGDRNRKDPLTKKRGSVKSNTAVVLIACDIEG